MSSTASDEPKIWPWLLRGFTRHVSRDLRRSFANVRLLDGRVPSLPTDHAAVIYLNHPSWWDPMMCAFLASHSFPGRRHFAAIDSDALQRYPLFDKLGFFGVERGTVGGARAFLRLGAGLLERPRTQLWITPRGEFQDASARPVVLAGGLAHLLSGCARARLPVSVVPLALVYGFWTERRPEALLAFGEPSSTLEVELSDSTSWQERLERDLERTLDRLAGASAARDEARLPPLLEGRSGIFLPYDLLRRCWAHWRGRPYRARHGS